MNKIYDYLLSKKEDEIQAEVFYSEDNQKQGISFHIFFGELPITKMKHLDLHINISQSSLEQYEPTSIEIMFYVREMINSKLGYGIGSLHGLSQEDIDFINDKMTFLTTIFDIEKYIDYRQKEHAYIAFLDLPKAYFYNFSEEYIAQKITKETNLPIDRIKTYIKDERFFDTYRDKKSKLNSLLLLAENNDHFWELVDLNFSY